MEILILTFNSNVSIFFYYNFFLKLSEFIFLFGGKSSMFICVFVLDCCPQLVLYLSNLTDCRLTGSLNWVFLGGEMGEKKRKRCDLSYNSKDLGKFTL